MRISQTPSHLKEVSHVQPDFAVVCVAELQLTKQQLMSLSKYFGKTETLYKVGI